MQGGFKPSYSRNHRLTCNAPHHSGGFRRFPWSVPSVGGRQQGQYLARSVNQLHFLCSNHPHCTKEKRLARPVTVTPLEFFASWPSRCPARTDLIATSPQVEAVRITIARLSSEREARGLSWRQLGEITGVNYANLRKAVIGDQWPRAEHIAACELALGIQLWPSLDVVQRSLEQYHR